jgi:hypothetical protein
MVMPSWQCCPQCGEGFLGSDAIGDPCPTCQGKLNRQRNTWREILRSAHAEKKLKTKTNREIADLLLHHVWAIMDITDPVSMLIGEAIERLKR